MAVKDGLWNLDVFGFAGLAPALTQDAVRWQMTGPVERPRFYRFQLLLNDAPVTQPALIFPGATPFYLIGDRLAAGPPPPFPLDHVNCPLVTDVPKEAVESPSAIAYLLASNTSIPAPFTERIKRRQLKAVVSGRLEVEPSSGKPVAYH